MEAADLTPSDRIPATVFLLRKPTHLSGSANSGARGAIPLEKFDYEYCRNGTANLFVFVDAHRPWRHVKVTSQRTAIDFAECMRDLVDVHYPKAERIRVVLDNLSTHLAKNLYEAFPAEEARRILRRLEFHYTPKHASANCGARIFVRGSQAWTAIPTALRSKPLLQPAKSRTQARPFRWMFPSTRLQETQQVLPGTDPLDDRPSRVRTVIPWAEY